MHSFGKLVDDARKKGRSALLAESDARALKDAAERSGLNDLAVVAAGEHCCLVSRRAYPKTIGKREVR